MTELPKWALQYKRKGTQITRIKNNYYLYEISSVWDPRKKRARKVTEKYLGKLTPGGLIKSKHERIVESLQHISVKEFGATDLLLKESEEIAMNLRENYPEKWKELLIFSFFRLMHNSPIKGLHSHYTTSCVSEMLPGARLSPKSVAEMLRQVGKERNKTRLFLQHFITGNDFAIIDLTHVFSLSEGVISSVPGYNSKEEFLPQIHMIFLFSLDQHMPAYFRMVPGSITDVTSLTRTVSEADIHNVVVIGDKGFYSETNVLGLENEKMHYILPLKRNSSLIDYANLASGSKRKFDGHFIFEKRLVWHYSYLIRNGDLTGRRMVVFLDDRLKTEEEKDQIMRIDEDSGSMENFFDNQYRQGTIAVITDLDGDAKRIYELLKARVEIEIMFDVFKNVLHADRTYMRDDYQMEGWMLVNFIALVLYYKIYRLLADHSLLKKYTPRDVLIHLSRFYKLKIGDEWINSEIPKDTRKILENLELSLPIT